MASVWKTLIKIVYSFWILACLWKGVLICGESEEITEDNWDMLLKGHWMIKFYAPWCPACRNLRPIWDKFAIEAESLNVRVAEVDVTKNSALSGRFGIVSLPTVYHAINGEFRLYQNKRRLDEMKSFIEERKWEDLEAIPSWKSPGSVLMGGLGILFKASMLFKNIHTVLTETYGLPAWGSYAIFGVGTVLIGLILGVVLVCLSDYLFGTLSPDPKYSEVTAAHEKDDGGVERSEEGKEGTEDEDKEKDGSVEQNATEASNVRKRAKKLKATTG